MNVEITEFEEIDPSEVHLVKRGANGFPPLLAKQVSEEIASAEAGEDLAADAAKADADESPTEPVEKDGVVSGGNPMFAQTPDASVPGSPTWEAADADTAAEAASALMQAAECIRQFAAREGAEVAAGEGSDLIDEFDALCALDAVTCALGIMARLAFLEGAEAAKSHAAKAGARNSKNDLKALRAARDHLNSVIGNTDDTDGEDAAEKSQEDPLAMTKDELIALLDERDAARKAARRAEKAEAAKAADEAEAAKKAAKAEDLAALSDEEREARGAEKAEKRAAKEAEKAEKEAAKAEQVEATAVAVAEKVEAAIKGITVQVESLTADLETVKKMAVPGGPVKTRSQADLNKSAERDALDIEAAKYDRLVKDMVSDPELRRGYAERAAEVRQKIAAL